MNAETDWIKTRNKSMTRLWCEKCGKRLIIKWLTPARTGFYMYSGRPVEPHDASSDEWDAYCPNYAETVTYSRSFFGKISEKITSNGHSYVMHRYHNNAPYC